MINRTNRKYVFIPFSRRGWIYNYLYNQCISSLVFSSNSANGEVYSIQHYVMFVSDLRQAGDFLQVLQFHHPLKLTATI
jgi:hypothetical protein